MSKLSTPKDLKPRDVMVDTIISLIEAEFAKDPNFDTPTHHLDKPKKRVEIEGAYELADRQAVADRYRREAGWGEVTHLTLHTGKDKITSFIFHAK